MAVSPQRLGSRRVATGCDLDPLGLDPVVVRPIRGRGEGTRHARVGWSTWQARRSRVVRSDRAAVIPSAARNRDLTGRELVIPSGARNRDLTDREFVIPSGARNRDLTGRGAGLVIRYSSWLLVIASGYWVPALEPLPSPLCRLPSAICSSLPSAL